MTTLIAFPHSRRPWSRAGGEHSGARTAFAEWVEERMRKAEVPEDTIRDIREQIIQPTETAEMGMTYTEWAEGHRREAREEQSRMMVLQLASRKFGAETAERLEELVGTMGTEQLVRVGDAVVDCETGDDLLAEAANGASGTS